MNPVLAQEPPTVYTQPGPEPLEPAATVALIPDRMRPDGPITTARLRRTAAAYVGAVAAGVALTRAAGERPLANAGLGLAAPGAGFLGARRPGAFAATQGAFGLSLVAWLGSGNILAPITTWLGSAALSARPGQRPPGRVAQVAVPTAAAATLAGAWAARERGHRSALERRERRNAHLREVAALQSATPRRLPEPRVEPELSVDELALARFALDRALQPVDEWNGFDQIEQFQTSSVRYQVTTMGHALSSLQYARTPAFHGYLSHAQRNLIDKWQERICWAYWAKESIWGHLHYNPDPVPRDNIMLTGWLTYQIASYVSNTGDTRYSEPGSITFRHPRGQEYRYDLHSLTRALVDNFERSDFCLYPCEPNWIYALCNGYGILPLPMHDRMFGTDYAERVLPSFRRGFENEFLSADGRTIGIRSALTGLTIPAMTSILSDAAVVWQLAPVFPDLARGLWETVRHEWVRIPERGQVEVQMRGWDKIDTGNYKPFPATALAAISWAAKEMGDMELAERLLADAEQILDPVVEGGVKRFRHASTLSNSALLGAVAAGPFAHRQRVARGMPQAWQIGPVLDECRYPDVLVAHAVSDGNDLRLVLRPGDGPGRQTLRIADLLPEQAYDVTGALQDEITGDAAGNARLDVDLEDRVEIHITPRS
jgi:Linalool dehydratase/isomerase